MIWQLQHALTIIAPKLKEIRSSETADETGHSFSINIMIFTQFVLVQIRENKNKKLIEKLRKKNNKDSHLMQ